MPRGKPFTKGASGNPAGKPKGARHKTTLAIEALLDGEGEALTRKAIEKAKDGDMAALRLCLDRIAPPRKDRPAPFVVRKIQSAAEAASLMADIVSAVSVGDLTPVEAAEVSKVLEIYVRAIEASEFERRIGALEAHSGTKVKGGTR